MSSTEKQAAEEDWQRQLAFLQEAEELEKAIEIIPTALKTPFKELIDQFQVTRKILIYRVLNYLNYEEKWLQKLYSVMTRLSIDDNNTTIDLLVDFYEVNLVTLMLTVLDSIDTLKVREIIDIIPKDDIHHLMQVARHISPKELEIMISLINELCTTEVIKMVKHCDEPFAKHCRLCRQRRENAIQQRMVHNQFPEGMVRVAGALPIYDRSELWRADDERNFSFDGATGVVKYFHYEVDLVRICDNCLSDVNHAMTNFGRFQEIHHVEPSERKQQLAAIKASEQQRAIIIGKVARERLYRRTREFCLRALQQQRIGLKLEAAERERVALELKRKQDIEKRKKEYQDMVERATGKDKKWRDEDKVANDKRFVIKRSISNMNIHPGFSDARPAPIARENSLTWRLKQFDEEDLPLTEEAATVVFGSGFQLPKSDDLPQLISWKTTANQRAKEWEDRQLELKAIEDEQSRQRLVDLKALVKERTKVLDRYSEQRDKLLEQQELDRLERRAHERQMKKHQQRTVYIDNEGESMLNEDKRSYQLRFYEWELQQIQRERDDMFNEAQDQTELDRFWGLDIFEIKLMNEEARLRRLYEAKVEDLNRKLATMGSTQPVRGKVVKTSNQSRSKHFDYKDVSSNTSVSSKSSSSIHSMSTKQSYSSSSKLLSPQRLGPLTSKTPSGRVSRFVPTINPYKNQATTFSTHTNSKSNASATTASQQADDDAQYLISYGIKDKVTTVNRKGEIVTINMDHHTLLKKLKAEEIRGQLQFRIPNYV